MKHWLIFSMALGAATLSAQSFNDAAEEAQSRLDNALNELDTIQQEINELRPQLGARLDDIENEAFRLRDTANSASRVKAGFDVEVSQLNNERRSVTDNNRYIQSTLLNEYARRLEFSINAAEIPLYQENISRALRLMDVEDRQDDSVIFGAQIELVKMSLQRIQTLIGGHNFEGEAIVNGTIMEGSFTLAGPASYFSTPEGTAGITAGMSNQRANIYVLPDYAAAIATVTTTGSGILPVDTTKGEALEGITHTITLTQEIAMGGMVMYPILILFALAILIAIFKAIELIRVKPAKSSDLHIILGHLRTGNNDAALAHAKTIGGPVGEMLERAVEAANEDKEVIEEILYETIIKTQPKLERFLAFIAVVAATAPLLGLLGTVTGMIKTFKLITIVGTGDAKNLSSGISEALITTKWGLIVAIPTLIMHALLNRKAKGVVGSMEQAAVGFINGITDIREHNGEQA